jgi:hypothetical protein
MKWLTAESRQKVRHFVKKSAEYYKTCAIMLCNTFVLFVLLNLVLLLIFKVRDSYREPPAEKSPGTREKYGMALLEKAYQDYDRNDLNALLDEHDQTRMEFESFTQFKERPCSGKWINVDRNGFRHVKNQGPWPPQAGHVNIFLFGGSTGFGYRVGDEETIASYLQEFLQNHHGKAVKVYNFGRGAYYSSQERVLLEKLLLAGSVPNVALFIDGYNDFGYAADKPEWTDELEEYMDGGRWPPPESCLSSCLSKLPIMRAARHARFRLGFSSADQPVKVPRIFIRYPEDVEGDAKIIERYSRNKRMIEVLAEAYGVVPVFVWQPIPWYKYDLKYHLFAHEGDAESHPLAREYPLMAKWVKERPITFSDNFLWLADIQEKSRECNYNDALHYNKKFSKEIATHIGRFLRERKLLDLEISRRKKGQDS